MNEIIAACGEPTHVKNVMEATGVETQAIRNAENQGHVIRLKQKWTGVKNIDKEANLIMSIESIRDKIATGGTIKLGETEFKPALLGERLYLIAGKDTKPPEDQAWADLVRQVKYLALVSTMVGAGKGKQSYVAEQGYEIAVTPLKKKALVNIKQEAAVQTVDAAAPEAPQVVPVSEPVVEQPQQVIHQVNPETHPTPSTPASEPIEPNLSTVGLAHEVNNVPVGVEATPVIAQATEVAPTTVAAVIPEAHDPNALTPHNPDRPLTFPPQ